MRLRRKFVAFGYAYIYVPLSLQMGGAGAPGTGGIVFSQSGDAFLLGRSLDGLRQSDPKLDALLVSSMQSMSAQMIGLAILFSGLTWFAVRQGRRWALVDARALRPAQHSPLRPDRGQLLGSGCERSGMD